MIGNDVVTSQVHDQSQVRSNNPVQTGNIGSI